MFPSHDRPWISQLDPRAGIVLDADKFQREIATLLTIPDRLLRSPAEVQQMTEEALQTGAALQAVTGEQGAAIPSVVGG